MKRLSWKEALLLSMAAVVGGTASCRADSIWQKRHQSRAYLFHDSRARNVGDLLTLVISESTTVGNRENTALNKSSNAAGVFDFDSSSSGGFGEQGAAAGLDISGTSNRGFQGAAAYNDSRRFTDQITVTVVDVLPNGNLVISGERCLTIAGERRKLNVSGVVRAVDIGPDNRVNSRFVAGLITDYDPEGVSQKFTRQGWMSRAVNKVWPF